MGLSEPERAILEYAAKSANPAGWVERLASHGAPSPDTPHRWGWLVRKGFLRTAKQSERPIHEPYREWTIYYITEAGRRALADAKREGETG